MRDLTINEIDCVAGGGAGQYWRAASSVAFAAGAVGGLAILPVTTPAVVAIAAGSAAFASIWNAIIDIDSALSSGSADDTSTAYAYGGAGGMISYDQ